MMQIEVNIVGGSLSGAGKWPVRTECVQVFTNKLTHPLGLSRFMPQAPKDNSTL